MLTVLLPVTRPWAREPFCAALGASDVPRGSLILVLDAPDCSEWAPTLKALGFTVEIHQTGNPSPPEGTSIRRRPRHAQMRTFTLTLVPDGPLLCLDDDTLVPSDVYARLSAIGPHASAVAVGRHNCSACGVYSRVKPLRVGRGIQDIYACGHFCLLTTGEMYRRCAVALPGKGEMRPIPGLKCDWDCVCGHLTEEGVLRPDGR